MTSSQPTTPAEIEKKKKEIYLMWKLHEAITKMRKELNMRPITPELIASREMRLCHCCDDMQENLTQLEKELDNR